MKEIRNVLTIRVSLQFEKEHSNIDSFRGFIEKFSLFSNRSESLIENTYFQDDLTPPPPHTPQHIIIKREPLGNWRRQGVSRGYRLGGFCGVKQWKVGAFSFVQISRQTLEE